LLTAVHKDSFRIISHRELLFNDFGDRVAQLLHVELIVPFSQCRNNNVRQEILIVNTHLLFPHNSSLCLERLRQVYKILQYVESYQYENKLNPLPILLCGDWNGSKSGHVYKFLRSQGFISSYDAAHVYADADAHKWVSHRNHRGNICGVDFIWLLNPNRYRKLLKTSWSEALAGMLKLNLVGHCHGLCNEEVKELWLQADVDRNGVIDYKEFKQQIWNTYSDQGERERDNIWDDIINGTVQTIGFSVKNAVLFPAEVEKGMWPEDYSLSDHARLTVVFSPVRMPCSRLT
ncbi:putative calcium-binding protein, partial [Sesamum angolense]